RCQACGIASAPIQPNLFPRAVAGEEVFCCALTLKRLSSSQIGGPLMSTRREFLERTAGLTAGAVLAQSASAAQPAPQTLPTIRLGTPAPPRLIIGGNPIYGYSHFNRILSRSMTDWHTPERVVQLLRRCEEVGINTWQNSYAERTLSDLDAYRKQGGRMHWLCLGKPDWDEHPDR